MRMKKRAAYGSHRRESSIVYDWLTKSIENSNYGFVTKGLETTSVKRGVKMIDHILEKRYQNILITVKEFLQMIGNNHDIRTRIKIGLIATKICIERKIKVITTTIKLKDHPFKDRGVVNVYPAEILNEAYARLKEEGWLS